MRRRVANSVLAGWAGLAVGEVVAAVMGVTSPLVAVAEWVVRLTPGAIVEGIIRTLGTADKPFLFACILGSITALLAWAGTRGRASVFIMFGAIATLGGLAIGVRDAWAWLPLLVGLAVTLGVWKMLDAAASDHADDHNQTGRRRYLTLAGLTLAGTAAAAAGSRWLGQTRTAATSEVKQRTITGLTKPNAPQGVQLPNLGPWQTPAKDFYRIDTAISPPVVSPSAWTLRIHGMVDREITLTFDELIRRPLVEAWVTLNCVSNPVGGEFIGNAWWSGYALADLLREAGISPDADALLQKSHDGWTCGTPISVVMDGRPALLAVAMNGEPLPIEHGFPVRTIVPGLYGFVSATKWVVDIEVTRFEKFTAFWTSRGWAAQAPVKIASRIDLPRANAVVTSGKVAVGGAAWHQHTGIKGVEVSVDGGAWLPMRLGPTPSTDAWVQWSGEVEVAPGKHAVRVRAIGADGEVQTGAETDVAPDGPTGWHSVSFEAR